MIKDYSLTYPMFAMVVLTFVVLLALFRSRYKSVASGQLSVRYFETYRGGEEPDASIQLSRHFMNLFESPVLFYVVCLSAMVTGQSDLAMHVLAWLYIFLRAVHAYIHIGKNKLRPRIGAYFLSWTVLLLMWAYVTAGAFLSA